jgi:hypothetical protein
VLRYDRTEHPAAEIPREERGKAALTELFESLRGDETPIIVENVVNEVDEVVRAVRFEGWQNTDGDRLVQQALRKTLYSFEDARHLDISAARGGSPESVLDGWLRLLEAREDLARGELKSLRYRTELLHPLRSAAEFGKGFHGALRQLRQLGGLGPESHGVHLRHVLVRRDLGFPGLSGGLRGVQGDPRGGA